ncbi:MAG: hypothetical protein IPN34_17605 [Planctomycetes bacterium]|nr:hypothetical protein [Planctomycetota bacterium]
MDELLVDGGKVEFSPDPGWAWAGGWDGSLSVSVSPHGMTSDGKAVASPEDLERLASLLLGRSYTATGFSDVPGSVLSASIRVDRGTLSQGITVGGANMACSRTKGTFRLSCTPALKAGSPPVPDPAPAKSGTWQVVQSGQSFARVGR